jgi:hypothetical protein
VRHHILEAEQTFVSGIPALFDLLLLGKTSTNTNNSIESRKLGCKSFEFLEHRYLKRLSKYVFPRVFKLFKFGVETC